MNNNYDISEQYHNNYDPNGRYFVSQTTSDSSVESMYRNNGLNPQIGQMIASNIAYNYNQNYANNWSQTVNGYQSYPYNGYQNYPFDGYSGYNPFLGVTNNPFPQKQNNNYLDYYPNVNQNNGLESQNIPKHSYGVGTGFDDMIPITVKEVEKNLTKVKPQCNEWPKHKSNNSLNCFETQEVLKYEPNYQTDSQKENSDQAIESLHSALDQMDGQRTENVKNRAKRRRMGKPMSLEEKREMNRLAALKCRQKKLSQIESLAKRKTELTEQNRILESEVDVFRQQLYNSKLILINHKQNGCLLDKQKLGFN